MGIGNQDICHWVDSRLFYISLTHYPPGSPHRYRKLFLRYSLDRPDLPRSISLGRDRPVFKHPNHGHVHLFMGGRDHTHTVWALDKGGVRRATSDENRAYGRTQQGPGDVVIKKVHKEESACGRDRDWNKYDIYLGKRWVRRSRSEIEGGLRWDPELRTYVWHEYGHPAYCYFMDAQGRYRFWFRGQYVGKVEL
jgi:hypothetical protein